MEQNSSTAVDLDPLLDLSGSTLYVYLILLTSNKPLGVREVQRRAGFRSPNSARHHLEKLVEKGYAIKTDEGYIAVKPHSSILSHLIYVRGLFLPKILFYAIFSSLATLSYILTRQYAVDIIATIIMTSLSILLWLDTISWLTKIRSLNKLLHSKHSLLNRQ